MKKLVRESLHENFDDERSLRQRIDDEDLGGELADYEREVGKNIKFAYAQF